MEPVYNIALEKQAIGRIHRMGQKKVRTDSYFVLIVAVTQLRKYNKQTKQEAFVIRLVAKDTVEEAMYEQRASAVGLSMRSDADSISSRDFRKLLAIK
jgi:SNF2 family DNA or RNA helicase